MGRRLTSVSEMTMVFDDLYFLDVCTKERVAWAILLLKMSDCFVQLATTNK